MAANTLRSWLGVGLAVVIVVASFGIPVLMLGWPKHWFVWLLVLELPVMLACYYWVGFGGPVPKFKLSQRAQLDIAISVVVLISLVLIFFSLGNGGLYGIGLWVLGFAAAHFSHVQQEEIRKEGKR